MDETLPRGVRLQWDQVGRAAEWTRVRQLKKVDESTALILRTRLGR